MKWIGQHIVDLIARFRGDVYLEDIDTGTIASGGNLGLDSNNKIVKATEATGDITGVDLTGTLPIIIESETNTTSGAYSATLNLRVGDGLNIDSGDLVTNDSEIDHDQLDNFVAGEHFTQANITTVGIIGIGQWRGTAINAAYLDGQSGTNTGDETLASINDLDITEVGTIDSGVWQGTAIASAYLDSDTAHLTTNQTFSGEKTFSDVVVLDGDRNYGGEAGLLHLDASTITDTNTSASATSAEYRTVNIEPMNVAATNASVTTTDAASLKISGAPAAGTNMTLTNTWALWVDNGNARFDAGLKLDDVLLSGVQTSSESFADNDTSIMTSGAIKDTLYSTSYITFSVKTNTTHGTNYILMHGNGISGGLVSIDSGTDSATDFGTRNHEDAGDSTETCSVATGNLEQQIPIPETCKLMGFYATTTTTTNTGAAYDTGVAIWHVPEANVNWGASVAGQATLIHKSDSSMHAENTAHSGSNRKKVQKVKRMGGTVKTLAAGDIIVPSVFGETADQQITATITLVIATPIKTI
tara:strand:- start:8714 stop:10300 length:1587 start_codon:yes stop_codon:yes gene_type:complete